MVVLEGEDASLGVEEEGGMSTPDGVFRVEGPRRMGIVKIGLSLARF